MAKPIKHTPVLKGRDAVNFFTKIEDNKNKKIDKGSLLSIQKDAAKLRSLFKA